MITLMRIKSIPGHRLTRLVDDQIVITTESAPTVYVDGSLFVAIVAYTHDKLCLQEIKVNRDILVPLL